MASTPLSSSSRMKLFPITSADKTLLISHNESNLISYETNKLKAEGWQYQMFVSPFKYNYFSIYLPLV